MSVPIQFFDLDFGRLNKEATKWFGFTSYHTSQISEAHDFMDTFGCGCFFPLQTPLSRSYFSQGNPPCDQCLGEDMLRLMLFYSAGDHGACVTCICLECVAPCFSIFQFYLEFLACRVPCACRVPVLYLLIYILGYQSQIGRCFFCNQIELLLDACRVSPGSLGAGTSLDQRQA